MRMTPGRIVGEGRYPKEYPVGLATDDKELCTSGRLGRITVSYEAARRLCITLDGVDAMCAGHSPPIKRGVKRFSSKI